MRPCIPFIVVPILGAMLVQPARAITCPGSGSKVKVVIDNPTGSTGQQITITGASVANEITCTSASTSYSQTVTLYQANGPNEFILPSSGGLVSGVWVHHISANAPNGQEQYQQGIVLYASAQADYATVNWTYFPNVIIVNQTGDTSCAGCSCTFACTLREAFNKAIANPVSTPTLIRFTQSPGTMTQTLDLHIGSGSTGPITVDGTDSNGNPWVVGDALAAAQGKQDPFTRTIDMANVTKTVVAGDDVTIKGLALANTVASGNPTKRLIESSNDNLRVEAVRLDGGATGTCSNCNLNAVNHLIDSTGANTQIVNVEARSAYGAGADLSGCGSTVRDSWFHNNYVHNLAVDQASITRNMIEFAGQRATDGSQVNLGASGIYTIGTGDITAKENIVRNNSATGMDILATGLGADLSDDYVCGNGDRGAVIYGGGSSVATMTGVTAAYNDGYGVNVDSSVQSGSTLAFNNDSAFTANSSCGLRNQSSAAVGAANNQWRDLLSGSCASSVDRCSGGTINCSTSQDWFNQAPTISTSQPTFPSNVFQTGSTVRVQGSFVNAIHGNPESDPAPLGDPICAIGISDVSDNNCCRKKNKANLCTGSGATTPPVPVASQGNCVAISNAGGAWYSTPVTGITPTTITAEIANPILCLGGDVDERVRVSKKDALNNTVADEDVYCLNKASL